MKHVFFTLCRINTYSTNQYMMADNLLRARHRPKTRAKTKCPVFGMPQELSDTVLPTYESVMKCYLLVKRDLKSNNNNKDPTVAEISEKLAANTERVWFKSSIPLTSHQRVIQLIRAYC